MEKKAKRFHAVDPESHAREFLASERTFLAWIRTSVAIIGFGFAIIKFDVWTRQMLSTTSAQPYSTHMASSIGAIMVLFGGLMSALGAIHYRRTNKQVLECKVESSNRLVLAMSGSVVLLAVIVLIYLLIRGEF